MAQLEYAALQCEAEGSIVSLREAREHRRLLLRVLDEFEQSLRPGRRGRRAPGIDTIMAEATRDQRQD
jgi:hypothetical protein